VARIDFIIRKFSRNFEMNSRQFEDVVKALNLLAINRGKSTKITSFYESFKTPTGTYTMRLLLLCGILLGYGQAHEKARLLFEAYDIENTHSISLEEATKMVDDLFEVTVNRLSSLVAANQGETDPIKVRTYIDKINYRMKNCKAKLLLVLTEGNSVVTRDAFVRVMNSTEYQRLTTSSGLREYFYRVYQSTPSAAHIDAARQLLESQFAVPPAGRAEESA
jgi:Ca2+-binding EF-hand superfamily protein